MEHPIGLEPMMASLATKCNSHYATDAYKLFSVDYYVLILNSPYFGHLNLVLHFDSCDLHGLDV